MANRDIVAIGASAGGVEVSISLTKSLPRDLPASVLLTIHLPRHSKSSLDDVLDRSGPLGAGFAQEGEAIRKSRIYIALPDRHLIVDGDRLALGEGPRENNSRPAIDLMLRSAAVCCGGRAIGVVMTGGLGDGASGLWTVEQAGGITVVQDPKDAAFAEMPQTALSRVRPDHIVGLADIVPLLASLTRQPAAEGKILPASSKYEVEIARKGHSGMNEMDSLGWRSVLSRPDCGDIMWEIDEGELSRFRCHVGHAYAAELMRLALDENLRRSLASATRALDERIALARKLYDRAEASDRRLEAENWAEKLDETQREAEIIRASIRRMDRLAARVEASK